MIFRYTRFDNIYSSREAAIKKLNYTSRYFAENVCIQYKDPSSDRVEIILALYKSEKPGDYVINFDSASGGSSLGASTYEVTRHPGETDKDCINRATLSAGILVDRDLVVINEKDGSSIVYMYTCGSWNAITSNTTIKTRDTSTVKFNLISDSEIGKCTISATVPIDKSSIVLDPNTKSIKVGIIDGGNLKDLL